MVARSGAHLSAILNIAADVGLSDPLEAWPRHRLAMFYGLASSPLAVAAAPSAVRGAPGAALLATF
jgi:hypothetical protein